MSGSSGKDEYVKAKKDIEGTAGAIVEDFMTLTYHTRAMADWTLPVCLMFLRGCEDL